MTQAKAKTTLTNKALQYFNTDGWNCAESVYLAIFQEYYKQNITPKTVSAFGGGIAHAGGTCGAINVAIMGISQKYGRTTPKQPITPTQHATIKFLNTIIDQYGSLNCTKIKQQQTQSTNQNPCTPLIRIIIETFLKTIENNQKPTT